MTDDAPRLLAVAIVVTEAEIRSATTYHELMISKLEAAARNGTGFDVVGPVGRGDGTTVLHFRMEGGQVHELGVRWRPLDHPFDLLPVEGAGAGDSDDEVPW